MRSTVLFGSFLVLTVGCRAVPEEKSSDTAGHNLEDSAIATEDSDETGTIDSDTAQIETGDTAATDCNHELYVVGLSEEATNQGYGFGWNCFPTAPSFTGADIMIGGAPATDVTYYTFIKAEPEGDVVVDSVSFDIELEDNGNTGWGTTLNSLDEYATRITSWYTETSGNNPVDLGINIPIHENDRFGINVGTPDVTISAGEDRWVWINLNVAGLPVTSGDTVTFTGSTRITWHADNVPEVMTMIDPSDEEVASYTYTFPVYE